jgi:cysteine desulfurase/selenocysteine lyase
MTTLSETHGSPRAQPAARFNVARVRKDFPGLVQTVHGKPLVYLDNAATTQRPQAVIDATVHAYTALSANIHRGVHLLSARATDAFEGVRKKVQRFIHAPAAREVVFTRGTTEAINLVAQTFGRTHVHAGDEILITQLEHHANIVPWQMLCRERGAQLVVTPLLPTGEVDVEAFARQLSKRTKLVALSHVSNALGTIVPIRDMVQLAQAQGIPVLVDGAQAVPHVPVDVQALGCDFYTFSAHKMYGPTGVGVLWGRAALLEAMPPWQGGGDMIVSVTFEETLYNEIPHKFEAGTPDIAGVIGLGAALDYLQRVDWAGALAHEDALLEYGTAALKSVPGLRLIGTAPMKTSVLSFVLACAHPHDIGTILDRQGIAIRTGNHCAQPAMAFFDVAATARASLGMYNTTADIDALVAGLKTCVQMFS